MSVIKILITLLSYIVGTSYPRQTAQACVHMDVHGCMCGYPSICVWGCAQSRSCTSVQCGDWAGMDTCPQEGASDPGAQARNRDYSYHDDPWHLSEHGSQRECPVEDPLCLYPSLRRYGKEGPGSEDRGHVVFREEEQEQRSQLCGEAIITGLGHVRSQT